MTLSQANKIFKYWDRSPPEHEILALLARAYTNWEPAGTQPTTPEEHMASLEARWKAGAMNVKQLFEAMGGRVSATAGPHGPGIIPPDQFPGIGPFPGATVH
jgi:hypothetical protein